MVVVLVFMTPEAPAHTGQRKKILAEKVRQLMDWTQKIRVIRMNDAMFNHFVLEKPRNYSVIVLFTTLQKFRLCVTCKLALQEFQILADSWQFSSAFSNEVFFAMVDFDESPEVSEMLQVMSVPNVLHFSAKSEFKADDIYNFKERVIIAQQMFTWVAERTERRMVNVRTRKPINYYYSFKLGSHRWTCQQQFSVTLEDFCFKLGLALAIHNQVTHLRAYFSVALAPVSGQIIHVEILKVETKAPFKRVLFPVHYFGLKKKQQLSQVGAVSNALGKQEPLPLRKVGKPVEMYMVIGKQRSTLQSEEKGIVPWAKK
eukprot:bmy_10786T0